ncbi:hypothetical protein HN51_039536, partial [Arachis hypogaea]
AGEANYPLCHPYPKLSFQLTALHPISQQFIIRVSHYPTLPSNSPPSSLANTVAFHGTLSMLHIIFSVDSLLWSAP